MTKYETDPAKLAAYTEAQWEALLERLMRNPPGPRFLIAVPEPITNMRGENRQEMVQRMVGEGMTLKQISDRVGLSISMVSRIKNGSR